MSRWISTWRLASGVSHKSGFSGAVVVLQRQWHQACKFASTAQLAIPTAAKASQLVIGDHHCRVKLVEELVHVAAMLDKDQDESLEIVHELCNSLMTRDRETREFWKLAAEEQDVIMINESKLQLQQDWLQAHCNGSCPYHIRPIQRRASILKAQDAHENSSLKTSNTLRVLCYSELSFPRGLFRNKAQSGLIEALLGRDRSLADCYLEVQSGEGGMDSMDWCRMLLEMYEADNPACLSPRKTALLRR
eukprot:2481614-Amphidinium_carterae.1